jgi:hydrogenase maturation protein HypF
VRGSEPFNVDWEPMIEAIVSDLCAQKPVGVIAGKFHNTLAEMVVAVARRIEQERVVLTGGCFQNCQLTERCVQRLIDAGFRPYWHQRVPPNDGGIALGQIVAAARHTRESEDAAPDSIAQLNLKNCHVPRNSR